MTVNWRQFLKDYCVWCKQEIEWLGDHEPATTAKYWHGYCIMEKIRLENIKND